MKTIKTSFLLIVAFLLIGSLSYAQGKHKGGGHKSRGNTKTVIVKDGHHHHHGHGKKVVVSKFRPAKIVVYHPYWGPRHAFNRRWVYFPRHNFYWDNWRQSYIYWNGTIWLTTVTVPPVIVNVKLEDEKQYELKETDDDVDDVYKTNDNHKTEYKPE